MKVTGMASRVIGIDFHT